MTVASVALRVNPYPGLRPFREEEEYLFFGRETQVDAMVNKLAATRFLAVVGTSGSGKSSLVNCGLCPALHRGLMAGAGTAWRVANFRPGSNPLGAMAQSLAKDGVLYSGFDATTFTLAEIIETTLRMSKLGLIDIYEQARLGDGVNLLVVVDQFEELFRYRKLGASQVRIEYGVSDDATAFVNLLLEVRQQMHCPIYVVLTMRSDFLGDCAQFFGLPEAINKGQYLVPRMTRDERRAAIAGPAGVGGAQVAPVLLTRLVNDVGDNPDQLSILQHALNRTWACWQKESDGKGPLEMPHYEAIGTMAHALNQHAEETYGELGSARKRKICEKIFKALTDKGTDAHGVRRPTKLSSLCALAAATEAEVTEVIDVFRERSRSFLMPPAGEPLKAETVIDISHESLMRVWERLKGWGEEEAQSAKMYRRLAETAELHAVGKSSLWRDPDLQLALDWFNRNQPNKAWADYYHANFDLATSFLKESERNRDAEILTARRKKVFVGALFLVLFAVVALWGLNEVRSQDAIDRANQITTIERAQKVEIDKERREAVRARQEAERARKLAEERTYALLKQFGVSSEKLTEGGIDQDLVQQSLKANQEIQQASRLAPRETRRPTTVEYFPKNVDENKVESALMELGFTLVKKQAPLPGVSTNAIWYGSPVNIEDVKLVALTLIRAGVQIKAIRPFPDYSRRKNTALIQVGSDRDRRVVNRLPLTVEAIRDGSGILVNDQGE